MLVDAEPVADGEVESEFLAADAPGGILQPLTLVETAPRPEPRAADGLVSPPSEEDGPVGAFDDGLRANLWHPSNELAERPFGNTLVVNLHSRWYGDGAKGGSVGPSCREMASGALDRRLGECPGGSGLSNRGDAARVTRYL